MKIGITGEDAERTYASLEKEQNGLTIFFIFVKSSPKSQNENRCTGRRNAMR